MLVAYYQTVSQFERGESDCECGPYAVALNKYAGQNGPSGAPEDVDVLADQLWANFPHGSGGIDVPTLLAMLDNSGVQYQKIGSLEGNDRVENLTQDTALHWLQQGYPVICTVNETNVIDLDLDGSPYPWLEEDPWRSNPPNHIFTLAGIADDGNVLVADPANVNPFPRRYQLDHLNFITLVAIVPSWTPVPEGDVMIDITNHVVATYFSATPDGKWQCKQTGYVVQLGMLKFYKSYGQNAFCGLTYLGLPKSNEIPIPQYSGVVKQEFERGWLVYDPQHQFDNPPGAGDVYPMHLPDS